MLKILKQIMRRLLCFAVIEMVELLVMGSFSIF
jgi:hypothetical protein